MTVERQVPLNGKLFCEKSTPSPKKQVTPSFGQRMDDYRWKAPFYIPLLPDIKNAVRRFIGPPFYEVDFCSARSDLIKRSVLYCQVFENITFEMTSILQ